jgi:aryl-alcohol dehydrogenase-like predicted oxidoreductase
MKMQYGRIAGVDKPVSRILQGTSLQGPPEMLKAARDFPYMLDLYDGCSELGVTTFDTGHNYWGGNAERSLGEWMQSRGNREDVVILTKGAHHNNDRKRVTPWDIASDLHDSLARLSTDYIDIYLLHRDDPSLPVGPIIDALNEHKDAGRIRVFGASNWTHERIAEANAYAADNGLSPFTISSPNFTLAVESEPPWADCISLSGDAGTSARAWYAEQQMPLFLWSSMAQGFFSGRFNRSSFDAYQDQIPESCARAYCHDDNFERLHRVETLAKEKGLSVPQVALAWIVNQHLDLYTIVGVFTREECAENIAALDVELTPNEIDWLDLKSEAR